MSINIYILISFGILFLLYIIYNYNKNKSNQNDPHTNYESDEHFADNFNKELEYTYLPKINPYLADKKTIKVPDVFPMGESFLINPNTGLNKYGCNCICHNGSLVSHLAPCCGIKEVCGCPCHLGIDYDHKIKCCEYAIIN